MRHVHINNFFPEKKLYIELQGIKAQGIKAQGIKAQGIKAQGIKAQGIKAQGIKAQGIKPVFCGNTSFINNSSIAFKTRQTGSGVRKYTLGAWWLPW